MIGSLQPSNKRAKRLSVTPPRLAPGGSVRAAPPPVVEESTEMGPAEISIIYSGGKGSRDANGTPPPAVNNDNDEYLDMDEGDAQDVEDDHTKAAAVEQTLNDCIDICASV